MIPSLWTDMLTELEPEEAIRQIAKAGFKCVEFGLTHERVYLEGREDEESRLESIRRAAEESGVEILQMHGRLFNLCSENAEEDIAWAHRSIRRAGALGVKWVVLHPGSADHIAADPNVLEWTRKRNLEVFRAWLQTAEEAGTGIAIENMIENMNGKHRARFGAGVGDLLWLVEELDSPRVGICWDTGHAELSGLDQGRALRSIGKHLVALHIADNDGEADRHWAPGRGKVDWEAVLDALRSIGYKGPFNLEVPGEANATPRGAKPAKMRFLRELCTVLLSKEGIRSKKDSA